MSCCCDMKMKTLGQISVSHMVAFVMQFQGIPKVMLWPARTLYIRETTGDRKTGNKWCHFFLLH